MVTCLSTNLAWCRVTSLGRPTEDRERNGFYRAKWADRLSTDQDGSMVIHQLKKRGEGRKSFYFAASCDSRGLAIVPLDTAMSFYRPSIVTMSL